MEEKIIDGILGFCIGDALGVPVEFISRKDLLYNPVTEMLDFGTHNQPIGTWSDDSSMLFCLMESLLGGYNIDDIADRFVKWYKEGYWTPHGKVFDIGNATFNAIKRINIGYKALEAGGSSEADNGNGSLMRILPLSYYLLNNNNIEERIKVIHDVSAITHAHARSQMCCTFYVEMAINLLKGYNPNDSYNRAIEFFKSFYIINPYTCELKHFERVLSGHIADLSQDMIFSSGYVIHTLEAAIWCFLRHNSYKETVLRAVNLGDDTDTTAAVTGGLAGLFYGIESIPENWINIIVKKDDIIDLCKRFSNIIF